VENWEGKNGGSSKRNVGCDRKNVGCDGKAVYAVFLPLAKIGKTFSFMQNGKTQKEERKSLHSFLFVLWNEHG